LVAMAVIVLLTFISFIATMTNDQETSDLYFLVILFNILRFPTHTLMWDYFQGDLYFPGLFINSLFYALLSERLYTVVTRRQKNKTLLSEKFDTQ
jgi:surface polysaccharide O-acyltransferase-like enzyme